MKFQFFRLLREKFGRIRLYPLLTFLRLKFFLNFGQVGIYFIDDYIAGIDIECIKNLEAIKYIFSKNPLLIKLKFSLEEAILALEDYTNQIKKTQKEQCIFLDDELCASCVVCEHRLWNDNLKLPLCAHPNTLKEDNKQLIESQPSDEKNH